MCPMAERVRRRDCPERGERENSPNGSRQRDARWRQQIAYGGRRPSKRPPIRVRRGAATLASPSSSRLPDGVGASSVLNDQKLTLRSMRLTTFEWPTPKIARAEHRPRFKPSGGRD